MLLVWVIAVVCTLSGAREKYARLVYFFVFFLFFSSSFRVVAIVTVLVEEE